LDASKG